MLKLTVPIYYKDIVPRARKNSVMGLNWYAKACNVFKSNGKSTTTAAITKKKFHELVLSHKEDILAELNEDMLDAPFGYHVHYDVYLGRLGTDGHNVRSVIEKFTLDALEEAELITNDKYVYSTSSNFYLDRQDPRCEVTVRKHAEKYDYGE